MFSFIQDVPLDNDIVLLAKFYLKKRSDGKYENLQNKPPGKSKLYLDETLAAWGTMPLLAPRKFSHSSEMSNLHVL